MIATSQAEPIQISLAVRIDLKEACAESTGGDGVDLEVEHELGKCQVHQLQQTKCQGNLDDGHCAELY